MIKKYKKWFSLCHQWPFLITWGWPGYLLPVERSGRAKNPILPLWNFFMNGRDQTFTTSYMTQTPVFGTFLGNVEWVFLRKIHFCIHPFQPKNAISRAIKEEHWCTNKLAVNCFQKSTDYVVPLSSRNIAFVNRMIVAINHRNNYSSSFPSSSLLSQLAGLCQLPQTTLPSQYLWKLNESTNTVLKAKIQRILLTLRQGASFTLPGLTIWAFHWNQTSLMRTRQQASKANCVQYKTSAGPK